MQKVEYIHAVFLETVNVIHSKVNLLAGHKLYGQVVFFVKPPHTCLACCISYKKNPFVNKSLLRKCSVKVLIKILPSDQPNS